MRALGLSRLFVARGKRAALDAEVFRANTEAIMAFYRGEGAVRVDLSRITRLIHEEIRAAGLEDKPGDFVMEPPLRDGRLLYVGMARKASPLYHHHYWIDPTRCRIVNVLKDQ